MFNLIKMDLYRLVNAKSFKVMLCIITLFAFAISWLTYDDIRYNEKELKKIPGIEEMLEDARNDPEVGDDYAGDIVDGFMDGLDAGFEESDETESTEGFEGREDSKGAEFHIGIVSSLNDDWLFSDINFLSFFYADLKSGALVLFLAIFITLFINAEHKNGFEKNIIGHYPERIKPVCSKLIATTIYTFIIMAIHFLASLFTYLGFLGDRVYIGELDKYLPFLGASILMHVAFSWFICFLCILAKSSSLAMTIGIMMATNFTGTLYMGIDLIIDKLIGKNDIILASNALEVMMLNIGNVGEKISKAIPPKMIIIPLVYMVFSTAASIIIMRKRDVR